MFYITFLLLLGLFCALYCLLIATQRMCKNQVYQTKLYLGPNWTVLFFRHSLLKAEFDKLAKTPE